MCLYLKLQIVFNLLDPGTSCVDQNPSNWPILALCNAIKSLTAYFAIPQCLYLSLIMLYQDGTRLFSLSRFHINCLDYIVLFCVILEYFCIIKFLVTHPAPLVIVSKNRILIMEIVSSRESTLPATAHGWHIPSLLFIEIMQELLLKCPLSLFNLSVPFAVMMCHSHHPSTQTNYS